MRKQRKWTSVEHFRETGARFRSDARVGTEKKRVMRLWSVRGSGNDLKGVYIAFPCGGALPATPKVQEGPVAVCISIIGTEINYIHFVSSKRIARVHVHFLWPFLLVVCLTIFQTLATAVGFYLNIKGNINFGRGTHLLSGLIVVAVLGLGIGLAYVNDHIQFSSQVALDKANNSHYVLLESILDGLSSVRSQLVATSMAPPAAKGTSRQENTILTINTLEHIVQSALASQSVTRQGNFPPQALPPQQPTLSPTTPPKATPTPKDQLIEELTTFHNRFRTDVKTQNWVVIDAVSSREKFLRVAAGLEESDAVKDVWPGVIEAESRMTNLYLDTYLPLIKSLRIRASVFLSSSDKVKDNQLFTIADKQARELVHNPKAEITGDVTRSMERFNSLDEYLSALEQVLRKPSA